MILITGGLLFMATTRPTRPGPSSSPASSSAGLYRTINPVLASNAVSVVQPQRSGMASGANTLPPAGIATGIAVLGAVFQSQIVNHTTAAFADGRRRRCCTKGGQLQAAMPRAGCAGRPRPPGPAARNAFLRRTASGFSTTLNHLMIIGATVAFVGVVSAFCSSDSVTSWSPGQAPDTAAKPRRVEPRRRARSWPAGRPFPPRMLEPFILEGTHVRLEPLTESHIPALVEAAAADRSAYQWTYTPEGAEQMTAYVRDALDKVASGVHVAFATVRRTAGTGERDRVVGATRFCEIAYWQWPPGATHQRHGVPDVCDIGFTWLAGPAQRTPFNTEAKLLMMTHAFEEWQVHRVALQTDVRNKRSWAAIERLGGQLDGIMRADSPGSDDTVRTSARFSIVADEWPEVKARLTARLDSPVIFFFFFFLGGGKKKKKKKKNFSPDQLDGLGSRSPRRRGQARASVARSCAVQRVDGGLGLVGADGGHRLAGAVDLPGQLVGPLHRVAEDLDEGLDHGLEGGDVVVPDDDGPQVLDLEKGVDVPVGDDGKSRWRRARRSRVSTSRAQTNFDRRQCMPAG